MEYIVLHEPWSAMSEWLTAALLDFLVLSGLVF